MRLNPFKRSRKFDLTEASEGFTEEILREYNDHRPLGPQDKLCYAPYKSMYFAHHGKINVCCYSRTYVIGQYPKESIRQAWFGEKAELLRKYITNNNLDYGCEGCKLHILSGSYDVSKAKQYDEMNLNDNGYPSVMEFELDNTCNLECSMCSGDFSSLIRKNREYRPPLPQAYDNAFVEQLEEFIPHLQEVKFYGGEPFLIPIYYSIWEKIIQINPEVRISVQTNGTVLNERVRRIMEKSKFHIGISIESLDKTNYEAIRKNANFQKVMKNIEWFREYCREHDTFFGIAACAMQENWRELPELVRFCNEQDAPIYFNTVYFPAESSFFAMSSEKLQYVIDVLSSEILQQETPTQSKNRKHFEDQIRQLRHILRQRENVSPRFSQMDNGEGLKRFVESCIDLQSTWTVSERSVKRSLILGKLDEVIRELGEGFDYSSLFTRWNLEYQSSVFIHNMLNELETGTIEHLIVRFNGKLLHYSE